jgi:hypothetical protein
MFFVTLDRLEREPDTVPRGQNIVILHAGSDSDRPRLLKNMRNDVRLKIVNGYAFLIDGSAMRSPS